MKKISVFMAAVAAVTMAVNSGYADLPVYAKTDKSVTDETSAKSAEKEVRKSDLAGIRSERTVCSKFDHCKAVLVSDEIYYIAYNYGGVSAQIVTLDENGDVVQKGDLGYSADFYVTQLDDRIYVMYSTYTRDNIKTGTACKIFDTELNEIAEYDTAKFAKDPQYMAVNKNGVIYSKSGKIYSADFDGKNKRALLDLDKDCIGADSITSVAANNDYAAFTLGGFGGRYYGVIDLKTGEIQMKNDNTVFYPEVHGDYIMFPSYLLEWNKASGKVVVFDGSEFKTIEPEMQLESGQGYCTMTMDGRLITQEFSESKYGEENMCIRVYGKDGNRLKEIITETGYYPAGNNETIVYKLRDQSSKGNNEKSSYVSKVIEY